MRRDQKEERRYRLLYDVKLMRPGCVLLQRMADCDVDGMTLQSIGDWLTSPTPDMKVYTVTQEDLDKLVEITWGKEVAPRINKARRLDGTAQEEA